MNLFHSLIIKITFAVSALTALLTGVPVDQSTVTIEATTTPDAIIEVSPADEVIPAPAPVIAPRPVKVYTRPSFVAKPVGSFAPTVTELPAPSSGQVETSATLEVGGAITNEAVIPTTQMSVVTYNVAPQEGSPLEAKEGLTVEALREYVLSTNPDVVAFRKKMEVASAEELVNYLVQNGFTVVEN